MLLESINKEEICAIIVTYHPDEQFDERVQRALEQVGMLIIVDNDSSPGERNLLEKLTQNKRIILIKNDKNLGIATALNQGINAARSKDFKWAILFDQDTLIQQSMVDNLIKVYENYPQKEKIAVIGSNSEDINSKQYMYKDAAESDNLWLEKKTVITSGSFLPLKIYEEIGQFRDRFFIDHVDDEYCLRARNKGYKVLLACKPLMFHSLGNATKHSFLWIWKGTSNHSVIRRYYMTRNHVILAKEYFFKEPIWVIDTMLTRLKSFILMCLFEEKKWDKIKAILKGLIDGLFRSRAY